MLLSAATLQGVNTADSAAQLIQICMDFGLEPGNCLMLGKCVNHDIMEPCVNPETVNSIKTRPKNNPIELKPYRPNSTCSLYLDPEVQTELTDLSSVNLTGTNIFKLI